MTCGKAEEIGNLRPRIASDASICGGRPRIAGTRIRVADIVAALGSGETVQDILDEFPSLEEADIHAALNSGTERR